jgi:hypothetical protein
MSGPLADIVKATWLPEEVCKALFGGRYAFVAIVNGSKPHICTEWLQKQPESASFYEICDDYSDLSTGNHQIYIKFLYQNGNSAFNASVKKLAVHFKLAFFDNEKWTSRFNPAL